jgi:L-threonylcarbamoyladenylate synthase
VTAPLRRLQVSEADVQRAVSILRGGGVIAIPTDTVYGIAAMLDRPDAVDRIYRIKGRDALKALPILISSASELDRLGNDVPDAARALAERFWPGPLTIVVPASEAVPTSVRRNERTVGLRVPDSLDALAIIAGCGGALAVTSANLSGQPAASTADEVTQAIGDRLDFVVDGGPAPLATASTVVRVLPDRIEILRAGAIPETDLTAALQRRSGFRPATE